MKILKIALRVLPWLILYAITHYMMLGGGWEDLKTGRIARKVALTFSDKPVITEAHIYLLMGAKEQETGARFPIKPLNEDYPIYGEVVLTGSELASFLGIWYAQRIQESSGAGCHLPPYGFRIYEDGSLITETSLCWHCNNLYVETWPYGSQWYSFAADSEAAKKLLEYCDKKLPYPRPEGRAKKTK